MISSHTQCRQVTVLVGLTLWILTFTACNRTGGNKQPPAMPPPKVTVAKPIVNSVIDYREYTGRTAAIESVEIRARVSGYLESIEFIEGKEVKKGDLLFKIDARPYQQAILQAKANLSSQEAQVQRFQLDLNRARDLIATSAISQAELDLAIASAASGQAQLRALQASLQRAELDLEYTEVRSPIAGRTSRALVTAGNLVVQDTTVLTSVVSMDPIYAYFDVDESSALDYRERVRDQQVDSARDKTIAVALGLANEKGHPHPGKIDFVDNVTDSSTGNIQIRASFENKDGALLPGLFVRVRVPFTRPYEALLIPQTGLAMNQQGRYVLVVNDKSEVETRVVELGANHGKLVAIKSGIARGDQVIIEGLQKARPGSKVEPVVAAKLPDIPSESRVIDLSKEAGPNATTNSTADSDPTVGDKPPPSAESVQPADPTQQGDGR